ncbi:hypothetical protein LDENG_00255660, partial [Lucifuga dentata]
MSEFSENYSTVKSAYYLKDHTTHFACLSLLHSIFIHVTLLTIISQSIKLYFSFSDILQNHLIFQNQIFKRYTLLKNHTGLLLGLYSLVEAYIHSTLFIELKH